VFAKPACQSNFASGNFLALWGKSSKITSEFKIFQSSFLSKKFSFSFHLLCVPEKHHPGNLGPEDEIMHQSITEFPQTLYREQTEST
jgi:hypothetical protein